jgi:hypothetical protein
MRGCGRRSPKASSSSCRSSITTPRCRPPFCPPAECVRGHAQAGRPHTAAAHRGAPRNGTRARLELSRSDEPRVGARWVCR